MTWRDALARRSWLLAVAVLLVVLGSIGVASAQSTGLQQQQPAMVMYPSDSCTLSGTDTQVVIFGIGAPNQDVTVRLSDTTGEMSVSPLSRTARSNAQGWYRTLFTISPSGTRNSMAYFISGNSSATVAGRTQCPTRSVAPTCVTPDQVTTLTGTVGSSLATPPEFSLNGRRGSVIFDPAGPNQSAGDSNIQPTNPARGQYVATGRVSPTYKPNSEAFPLLMTFAFSATAGSTAAPPPFFVSIPVTVCPVVPGSSSTTLRGTTSSTTIRSFTPVITVNPAVGHTGTVVSITGADFPPNTAVTFTWSRGIGAATANADSSGRITTSMLVMPNDLIGERTIQASGFLTATAPFLVVPGSQQPPGRNGLFFGR